MRNTRGTAAVASLGHRVFLFEPSVTVCAVVCACLRLMTGVPADTDSYSAELWRFSTSTRGWERLDITTANGAGPSGRWSEVITSVGVDLWVHGGRTGEGDSCVRCCCRSVARSCNDCVCCAVCTVHDLYVLVQGGRGIRGRISFRMSFFR
jgi:hypothetical protein